MANINSLTSNSYGNTSSYNLYGNRNVLTGLASGMDTESMIQNSISGYLMKITSLQQSQTKITWKQDAYRNIIDQMNSIIQKYTSYTSKTNLSSNAFFTSSVKTQTLGTYASAVSATGSTKSDIKINSVKQLATAARYSVDTSALGVNTLSEAVGDKIEWGKETKVGQVKGTITLTYGNEKIYLDFDANDTNIDTPEGLAQTIRDKLADVTVKTKDGTTTADKVITVTAKDNQISFDTIGDTSITDGNDVNITSVYGNVERLLGAKGPEDGSTTNKSFTVPGAMSDLVKTETMAQHLSGKTVQVTLNGVTKSVTIGDLAEFEKSFESTYDGEITTLETRILDLQSKMNDPETPEAELATVQKEYEQARADLEKAKENKAEEFSKKMTEELQKDLQGSLEKTFGKDKVTVAVDEKTGGLHFDVAPGSGSTLSVKSAVGKELGIGESGVTNYFNTASKLKDIVGEEALKGYRVAVDEDDVVVKGSGEDTKWYDADGNLLTKVTEYDEEGNPSSKFYRVNDKGEFIYSVQINGKNVGEFTEDTALESVLTAINSDPDAGVKVSYSNLTSQFVFTANETGADGKISFDNDLAKKLFMAKESTGNLEDDNTKFAEDKSVTYTSGQDAEIHATVNGKDVVLKRSSNVVEMDGLTVTFNKTFTVADDEEAVTFQTSSDSDKVVDAVKSFVEEINALMQSVHDAYATMPLTKSGTSSSSSRYEPLTDDDKKDMSESAITAYEEKAKTGLLFGDSDLSQLYSKLLSSIQASGALRIDMEAIGLTTTFSDGVTKLALDEDKLRAALDSDPDKVRNVFTQTVESGAKSNGLIASLKVTLNNYGSTSLASPGILVSKAGTKLSAISLMNNNLQKEYDNLEKQIEQWQNRMSDKVDYYTRQFTQLEKLMSTMNNQSSMLASLMGGY